MGVCPANAAAGWVAGRISFCMALADCGTPVFTLLSVSGMLLIQGWNGQIIQKIRHGRVTGRFLDRLLLGHVVGQCGQCQDVMLLLDDHSQWVDFS
jgi:hypothetical protein